MVERPASHAFSLRQRVRVAGRDVWVWSIDHDAQQVTVRYADGTEAVYPASRLRGIVERTRGRKAK